MALVEKLGTFANPVVRGLESLAPVSDLLLRLWVANVFWKSGLTKIQSWDTTLMLFEYEYSVPFLPPELAAYMGTGVELAFPVLLAFGIGGRFAAAVLFIFNIIAVISYPDLNTPGKLDHLLWGIMLLVPVLRGPGKISIDHFLRKKFMP